MKVKVYKNEYGYNRAKCPLCEYEAYVRDLKEPFKSLQRHLINEAKNEALEKVFDENFKTSHLDYVKAHVKLQKPKIVLSKYGFDGDLQK